MSPDQPLLVNDEGIWVEAGPGSRSGIRWDEVYAAAGYKLNGVTEVYTCLCFDWEYGEYFEVYAGAPGFNDLLAGLDQYLPGLPPDWWAQVSSLSIEDDALQFWCRDITG